MSPSSLVKLVKTLSGPEKRFFKLHSKAQGGNKEYLILYQLIEETSTPDIQKLKQAFKEQSSKGSWDNTCIYLGNMILDSLVKAKKEKDIFFELLQQIQEVKILQERSLEQEAYKQLKKIQQKASKYQLHFIEYYCYRMELNHHSDNNFSGIHDEQLVKLQMKSKEILKSLNHIHEHYSLYELLKYRLINSGKIVTEEGKKKLTDLMLTEMVLVSGKSKTFTSQKLHLLFQSFFFTDIGDYHSALKSFYQLNELLSKHEQYVDNPPLDYLSALNGIIESLRMLENETEVSFYLDKMKGLDKTDYPEFFRYLVKKTYYSQQILSMLRADKIADAKQIVDNIPEDIFNQYTLIDEEKQCELYFYCSLVYLKNNDLRKAHLMIREIMNQLKLPEQLLVSRAIRLLNIVIYYLKGESLHLEYEIRAYKRYFKDEKSLKIEKLVFSIIQSLSVNKRIVLMESEFKKLLFEIEKINKDRFEQQLLKYYNFSSWIEALINEKVTRFTRKQKL